MANEKRLIDANECLELLGSAEQDASLEDQCEAETIHKCIRLIKGIPTVDAVEVVRCKDCKFGDMCSIREAMAVSDRDAYCFRGERKDNEDT